MSNNVKTNYKEMAYEVIKNKIITCELMPGEIVDQGKLQEEIGVSRTPVREAINALEQEGLIVVMPRRGVIVSNISIHEIGHIYIVREAIEPLVAKLATPYVEKDKLESFYEIFNRKKLDYQLIFRNDLLLHMYIAEKTGNKHLVRLLDGVLCQNMRIVVLTAQIPERLQISNQEHLKIIEMMLKRDAEGAETAMRQHIESAKSVAFRVPSLDDNKMYQKWQ